MTLAKATVTGTVYRAPETRYTQNNIAVSSFTLKMDERDEILVRVLATRRNLSDTVTKIKTGDRLLIDGRLQTATTKTPEGNEKRFFEIDASDIEILSNSSASGNQSSEFGEQEQPKKDEKLVEFGPIDAPTDEKEELIDEEEIPF